MKDNKSTVAVTAGDKAFIFWRVRAAAPTVSLSIDISQQP